MAPRNNSPESPRRLILLVPRCKAISYGKPVVVSGNRSFSTFAGVFEQGNGRIGPAFLEVPLVILREACNAVCRFFKIAF